MTELAKIYARKYIVTVSGDIKFETYNRKKAIMEKDRLEKICGNAKIISEMEYLGIKSVDKISNLK